MEVTATVTVIVVLTKMNCFVVTACTCHTCGRFWNQLSRFILSELSAVAANGFWKPCSQSSLFRNLSIWFNIYRRRQPNLHWDFVTSLVSLPLLPFLPTLPRCTNRYSNKARRLFWRLCCLLPIWSYSLVSSFCLSAFFLLSLIAAKDETNQLWEAITSMSLLFYFAAYSPPLFSTISSSSLFFYPPGSLKSSTIPSLSPLKKPTLLCVLTVWVSG